MTKYDKAFFEMAKVSASLSKDRSTQVGAVIVDQDNIPRAMGFNGFPRGIDDNVEDRHARPAKYLWTEHAERNAIFNFARPHFKGTTLYVTHPPCADCARAIIQVGIAKVKFEFLLGGQWADSCFVARDMLIEAGVIYEGTL